MPIVDDDVDVEETDVVCVAKTILDLAANIMVDLEGKDDLLSSVHILD